MHYTDDDWSAVDLKQFRDHIARADQLLSLEITQLHNVSHGPVIMEAMQLSADLLHQVAQNIYHLLRKNSNDIHPLPL